MDNNSRTPISDGSSVGLPAGDPPTTLTSDENKLVTSLESYRLEAEQNRQSGLNPRDDKWKNNLDQYWGRYDFSKKASWQAKEVLPEVSSYVDRFAAALKEALIATPQGFYTVVDPSDREKDLTQTIKRMLDVWLSRSGRNQMGQLLPFSSVFEEQMKLGALMACSSIVTWKNDTDFGRVAIETVDPRNVWLDHTGRSLYRIRKLELDRHELAGLIKAKDKSGTPIFNPVELEQLINSLQPMDQQRKEELTGHGHQVSSGRSPITLHEYIATVVDERGEKIADRSLCVVANNRFLIRGPEANPFWHEQDFLTFTPLITTPLSVYGRSYMEDFGAIASTFIELTNMLLDAVHTSSLKAFALVPGMLLNPEQASEGLKPNKTYLLEEGFRAEDFAKALELGTLPPESIKMWEMLKNELSEGAFINEIGMGQFAPKGRTSATEITETKQSSSAVIRSIAQTIETRYLEPTLDLAWKTGLQHVRAGDRMLVDAAGEPMFDALYPRRKELIKRSITFQARGLSTIIAKGAMLKALISILQVVGSQPLLLQEFLKVVSMERFVNKLFELSNIDLDTLQLSEREKMIRSVTSPLNEAMAGATGQPGQGGAAQEMGSVARTMGIAR